jgi:hypothetical protein
MDGGEKPSFDGLRPPEKKPKTQPYSSKDDILLSWQSYDFDLKPKTLKWYSLAILLIMLALAYLVWQKDWFTVVVFFIIISVGYWYLRTAKPKLVTYSITPLGINADGKLYPFSEIHSFWMIYNDRVKKIYIAFSKKYLPSLTITIKDVDPVVLKTILLRRIPEQEKRGEGIADKIIRIIGL